MTQPDASCARLADLRIGDLLAEGGEGRVFEMPRQPHLVYKAYRRPMDRTLLEGLVSWPTGTPRKDLAERVSSASAWPVKVVVDEQAQAVGILMPRAPRRFSLRHKDGTTRLASLSYLTADPGHRAFAYGLDLPPPGSPSRIGLVLALARLLESFEAGTPAVGHGDLSTKNVLWSLQRGPEIFVIDCDNCERFDSRGEPLGQIGRRRAMTPNWDDPAVPGGHNPSVYTDRYSLALIFLRVVGAANYPVQARQREGGVTTIDFAVPASAFTNGGLAPGSPLWDLCARGLSLAHPADRPSASSWVPALEAALTGNAVGSPAVAVVPADDHDVLIRPVKRAVEPETRWTKVNVAPAPSQAWIRHYAMAVPSQAQTVPGHPSLSMSSPAAVTSTPPSTPIWPEVVAQVRRAIRWWLALHARAARLLASHGRRGQGLRRAGVCFLADAMLAVVGIFLAAMIASPLLGI